MALIRKKVLKDAVMTGTTVVYSKWIELPSRGYRTTLMHVWWTGTPTGTFVYEASCDEIINTEKDRIVGAASDGTQGLPTVVGASSAANIVPWTTAGGSLIVVGTANPAGAAASQMVSWRTNPAFVRLKYTNASGTGVLNARLVG